MEFESLSRIEAETRLKGRPLGTHLIRRGEEINDDITKALGAIESCLLTIVESNGKIAEYLLVHTKDGWTVYQGNPDLHDKKDYHFHPKIDEIIHSIVKRVI